MSQLSNSIADSPYRQGLLQGADQLGVDLTEAQTELLLAYLNLLIKWNKAYNLTAVRNPDDMLGRHLLDSLSIAPWVKGEFIADVGTGPGLPGIPMAILNPETAFTLMDSNGKKTRFLTQCKMELGLDNVTVVHGRVESFHPDVKFDQVLSRAFTALDNMVGWCAHLLKPKGTFLAMKGLYPEEEIRQLPDEFKVTGSERLDIPGCDGERHLIFVELAEDKGE